MQTLDRIDLSSKPTVTEDQMAAAAHRKEHAAATPGFVEGSVAAEREIERSRRRHHEPSPL